MGIDVMSFTFGILAIVALAEAIVLIVGIVKVIGLERNLEDYMRNMNTACNDISQSLSDNIAEVRSYIDSRIDKLNK
jgi:hypothetical protein